MDSLGKISLPFPAYTDTFFNWIRVSDCGRPCEQGKYRFQSKSRRVFKESGFFWTGEPEDLVYQLTIEHSRDDNYPGKYPPDFALKQRSALLVDARTLWPQGRIVADTFFWIGDRYLALVAVSDSNRKTHIHSQVVWAFSFAKHVSLKFEYKMLTRNKDSIFQSFIPLSIADLQQVSIHDSL